MGTSVRGSTLTLLPDTALLKAPSTIFPVHIDPTFNWHLDDPATPAFDEVEQGCPDNSFYDNSGELAGSGRLGVGYNGRSEGDCDAGKEHANYQWKLPTTISGTTVHSATVNASEVYSASCTAGSSTRSPCVPASGGDPQVTAPLSSASMSAPHTRRVGRAQGQRPTGPVTELVPPGGSGTRPPRPGS